VASALFPIDSGGTYRRFDARESGLATLPAAIAARAQPGFSAAQLGRQPAWIDFPGPPGTVPSVSFLDLIRGRVPAAEVRGRVVLIGATDPSVFDFHSYSTLSDREMTGVELEADATATALAHAPLRLTPGWTALVLALLVGVLPPALAVGIRPRSAIAGLLAMSAGYLLVAQLGFDAGWIVPVVVPEVTLVVAGGVAVALSFRLALAARQADLQAARRRAVHAGDDARRQVERDLHDGVQQRLVTLAMRLSSPSVRADPEVFDGSVDELRLALGELRQLARGTYPAVLETAGLAGGLASLADHCPVPVDLSIGPLDGLSPELARTAYFVASEALANALKHAGARRLAVACACESGVLELSVRDDGCGGADPDGSGLRGIAERAEAHGGTLTIDSRPEAGTRLTLRVPLP
jgi:signal transduction histidine kinase